EYVANLARANSPGIFTEIGFEGSEHSRSYGELFDDASRIAHTLKAIPSPPGECVLLCFESVIEHVAAAWACLLTGRTFLPLAISPFAHNRDKFLEHLREIAGVLCASLVLTEARFRECLSDALKDLTLTSVLDTAELTGPCDASKDIVPLAP